ncbi:MAG: peroxiredoxin [Gammaproteobacteria bacterium]
MLKVGDNAPDFTLPDEDGRPVALGGLLEAGPVLLVFYPRDFAPACARQLSMIGERHADLAAAGVTVLGISTDDLESHQRFRSALDLPFRLLSDVDQSVCHAYDVLGLFGVNTRRVTFVVGRDARIAGVAKATLRMQTHAALLDRVLERSA